QILEPEIDHVIDITNNESQNYIDPLEIATVSTEENDLDTISTKATVAPVNDLHNTPSHWNKLRNLVVVDENIPQTPIPSDLFS
ncbi:hypothetical protein GLOIN_2v1595068, partial [Rhizophagus irregularis DAOM 181602=DAOM 197198]